MSSHFENVFCKTVPTIKNSALAIISLSSCCCFLRRCQRKGGGGLRLRNTFSWSKQIQLTMFEKYCIGSVGWWILQNIAPRLVVAFWDCQSWGRGGVRLTSVTWEGRGCPAGARPYNCHTKVGLSEKGNKWNCESGRNVTWQTKNTMLDTGAN